MPAQPSTWGGRVIGMLQGVKLEHPVTSLRDTVFEIVTIPFTPLLRSEQVSVARALAAGRTLNLTSSGNLLVDGSHPLLPQHVETAIAKMPEVTYTVEIHWDILRRHPRIYCISPVINAETRPRNQHLFRTPHPGICGAQALCVYPPHYGTLSSPKQDAPGQLLLWIACYLACDAIQVRTGRWLGREASHLLKDILKQFGDSECWCGTGIPMRACHGTSSPFAAPTRPWRPA